MDLKYALTDRWDVQLGLRYSNYELWSDINVVFQAVPAQPPTFPIFVGEPELDEDNLDGKLALIYNLMGTDSNLYAIVAKGHINGGFNIVGGFPFEEEEIWSYELGWKGSWADGRVRTQLGAYYQTLSDFQAQFASADLPNQNILQNASGDSTITGVEFSMQALLGNLHLDLATAFLDSELGDFPDVVDPTVPPTIPPTLVNLTGGTAPFAPEISVNVGASYDFVLASGHLVTPRIDVSYVSDQNGAVFESAADADSRAHAPQRCAAIRHGFLVCRKLLAPTSADKHVRFGRAGHRQHLVPGRTASVWPAGGLDLLARSHRLANTLVGSALSCSHRSPARSPTAWGGASPGSRASPHHGRIVHRPLVGDAGRRRGEERAR